MNPELKPQPEIKPSEEIRAKILSIVDRNKGAYWGEFYNALISSHSVEEIRLALQLLLQDLTLRQDSEEHDWEYRRNDK